MMNGRCETCERESQCSYPYKPTACAGFRKFIPHADATECSPAKTSQHDKVPKSGSIKFRFIEFNHRRWLRGADAARVAVIDTDRVADGAEEWLWMSKSDIRMNIYMFGNDPELIKANEAYMKCGAA